MLCAQAPGKRRCLSEARTPQKAGGVGTACPGAPESTRSSSLESMRVTTTLPDLSVCSGWQIYAGFHFGHPSVSSTVTPVSMSSCASCSGGCPKIISKLTPCLHSLMTPALSSLMHCETSVGENSPQVMDLSLHLSAGPSKLCLPTTGFV